MQGDPALVVEVEFNTQDDPDLNDEIEDARVSLALTLAQVP
jgi:hypothetical protein